ncbi:MAG TPA: neutral/alkaline non-lysosomal ceramidase N-terminal domain-containing protein [Pirellulaceae bacterium]|nr:neutral/alkaline non-lysosomal ceramidase N-terminal domain-containing protein [Pirellulaceae bacterium]
MIDTRRIGSLVMAAVLGCLVTSLATAADTWKAGAAKANITPPSLMWMAGYGSRDHIAEGKLTDLWAKALVLEDPSGQRAALVTLDLVGIDRGLSQAICQELQSKYGLKRDQIAISTSHTHTGPVVARNLRPMHYMLLNAEQRKQVDDYAMLVEEQIVSVVGEAIEKLAPSQVSWGSGKTTFAVNRRTNKEPMVPEQREAGRLVGPVDHDVPVLAVRDPSGKLTAVTFGYACHATVLSFYQWSGDYPGFAQMALEEKHPGCVALFWAGCGADQNPLPRRTVEKAKEYGGRLAAAVEDVLTAPMTAVTGSLQPTYAEIEAPLGDLPTRDQLVAEAQSKDKFVASRAKSLLEDVDGGKSLRQTYPYPVQIWNVGPDVTWVFLGGEVVVDFAVRLKSELTGTRTWVAGYCNDVMAYIPSRRVLIEGGYEGGGAMVYYGMPTIWAPQIEEVIVAEVHRQSKAGR